LPKYSLFLPRSRLPATNPAICDLFKAWASHSYSIGQFETSAMCWLAAGDAVMASQTLAKRTDLNALCSAALMLADKPDQARLMAVQCAGKAVEAGDRDVLARIKAAFPGVAEVQAFDIPENGNLK
jgi:hypothetical protein